jgi:hypothetical protein
MTAAHDCVELEHTHALADGELTGAAADAARDHLAGCGVCQAELADVLQLDAVVRGRGGQVISLAWYRQRRLQVAAAAMAAAAAVVIYLALPRPGAPSPAPVAVALAANRMTEARPASRRSVPRSTCRAPPEAPTQGIALMAIAEPDRPATRTASAYRLPTASAARLRATSARRPVRRRRRSRRVASPSPPARWRGHAASRSRAGPDGAVNRALAPAISACRARRRPRQVAALGEPGWADGHRGAPRRSTAR